MKTAIYFVLLYLLIFRQQQKDKRDMPPFLKKMKGETSRLKEKDSPSIRLVSNIDTLYRNNPPVMVNNRNQFTTGYNFLLSVE